MDLLKVVLTLHNIYINRWLISRYASKPSLPCSEALAGKGAVRRFRCVIADQSNPDFTNAFPRCISIFLVVIIQARKLAREELCYADPDIYWHSSVRSSSLATASLPGFVVAPWLSHPQLGSSSLTRDSAVFAVTGLGIAQAPSLARSPISCTALMVPCDVAV